ncbi:MAG: YlbF family regulator [Ruminococcaceae bacterium]|nr:YlbF family regulator [Oscillospiraceae bacterium]
MDIIEAARQLGAAIQADERYKKVMVSSKANDSDTALQELISEFNLMRMTIDNEFNKPEEERNEEKIKEFNVSMRQLYGKIMCTDSMMAYSEAKKDFDAVMNKVNAIIEMSMNGEDPMTCEPSEGCSGSCATCGGCH